MMKSKRPQLVYLPLLDNLHQYTLNQVLLCEVMNLEGQIEGVQQLLAIPYDPLLMLPRPSVELYNYPGDFKHQEKQAFLF